MNCKVQRVSSRSHETETVDPVFPCRSIRATRWRYGADRKISLLPLPLTSQHRGPCPGGTECRGWPVSPGVPQFQRQPRTRLSKSRGAPWARVRGKPARVQRSEPRTALASPSRLSGPQQNWWCRVTPGDQPRASLPLKGRLRPFGLATRVPELNFQPIKKGHME